MLRKFVFSLVGVVAVCDAIALFRKIRPMSMSSAN